MTKAICKKCDFEDEYEPTEFGLDYYEAIGECPGCSGPTVNEHGDPTAIRVEFRLVTNA